MHWLTHAEAACLRSGWSRVLGRAALAVTLLVPVGCGGSKSKDPNLGETEASSASATPDLGNESATEDTSASKSTASVCKGADVDLSAALIQAACESSTALGAAKKDVKGLVEVKVSSSPSKVEPGGKADLLVTYKNLKKEPLQLDFLLDPTPRFSVEAYDAKGEKRVDLPSGHEPAPPKNASEKAPATQSAARITIAPGGSAHVRVPWEAVHTKWAPQKYNGTPLEMGYPRVPSGPLGKGKYQLRVATPLINVNETIEREFSAPRLDLEVAR